MTKKQGLEKEEIRRLVESTRETDKVDLKHMENQVASHDFFIQFMKSYIKVEIQVKKVKY